MDIPDTGAVFTIGKSHLSEISQSYFFIKNDPVRRLVCGTTQSAVICESGRLFVWGENQCGQLGIGSRTASAGEAVTKPMCVKTLKAAGERVRDLAFGDGFSIILTENNKIYMCGNDILGSDLNLRPVEIEEFQTFLSEDEDNNPVHFTSVSTGKSHFTVQISNGKVLGWGRTSNAKLLSETSENVRSGPVQIGVDDDSIKLCKCGPQFTLFVTARNEIFISGRYKSTTFPQLTKLQTNLPSEDNIQDVTVSYMGDIYITTERVGTFEAASVADNGEALFEKLPLVNNTERIQSICVGEHFYGLITENGRFYTTYTENVPADETDEPEEPDLREISKLSHLNVISAVSGTKHILLLTMPREESVDLQANDNEENNNVDKTANNVAEGSPRIFQHMNFNKTYTKPFYNAQQNCSEHLDVDNVAKLEKPQSDAEDVDAEADVDVDADVDADADADEDAKEIMDELSEIQEKPDQVQMLVFDQEQLNVLEKIEQAESSSGKESPPESLLTVRRNSKYIDRAISQDQLDEISEKVSNTSLGSHDASEKVILQIVDEDIGQGVSPKRHTRFAENVNEIDNHTTIIVHHSSPDEDDSNDSKRTIIRYIDNGVDVTDAVVRKAGRRRIDQSVQNMNALNIEDTLLGEKLSKYNDQPVRDLRIETRDRLRDYVDLPQSESRKKVYTPLPKLRPDQLYDSEDDDGKTTASVTSKTRRSPAGRMDSDGEDQFEIQPQQRKIMARDEEGRVKKFFKGLRQKSKDMSCTKSETAVVQTPPREDYQLRRKHQQELAAQSQNDGTTSFICVIS